MAWVITFLAIALIIATAGAKRRASKRYNLPLEHPALSLAILKENLLENPSEYALQKLKDFATSQNLTIPAGEFPLGRAKSIELDDDIFLQQATWLDSITPLEFREEPQTEKTLAEGILRLYGDDAIFKALKEFAQKFPSEKQQKLEQGYTTLCKHRDNSKADYESLENLRKEKEKWERLARKWFIA